MYKKLYIMPYKYNNSHFTYTNMELKTTLFQERAVFGKMKMDPAKRAQTQNAGEVSFLQWVFSQSVELMTDKVWPDLLLAKYFYN